MRTPLQRYWIGEVVLLALLVQYVFARRWGRGR